MSTDRGPGERTQLLVAVFCASCGESFPAQPDRNECPTCGCTLPARHAQHQCTSAAEAVEVDALIGTDFDEYSIEKLIGVGAMGRVYLARHRGLHRSVAIKILPPRLAVTNPDYLARFSNEARAAAALNHPNVITIHAIGEVRGFHYIETEFIAGQSLGQFIRSSGPLTPERATSIAALIAEGLSAAHGCGILHRDLKPDNVLMTHQGVPKVADFGLANRVRMDGVDAVSDLVGTPAYMAPELFQGTPASPTSDVYALGVCYFEMLTGRLPFPQKNAKDVIHAVQHDPIPNPRQWCKSLPLEMAECLFRLMSRAAGNRPQDAMAAAHLLQAVLGEVADLESLMRDAFGNARGVQWKKNGEAFEIELTFQNGRSQTVFVESTGHAVAERLLRIRSVCGKADPQYFETALKLNGEILHGALCIEQREGESVFMMVDSYPRATVDAEEIRRSVVEIAQRADAVERLLSTADRY